MRSVYYLGTKAHPDQNDQNIQGSTNPRETRQRDIQHYSTYATHSQRQKRNKNKRHAKKSLHSNLKISVETTPSFQAIKTKKKAFRLNTGYIRYTAGQLWTAYSNKFQNRAMVLFFSLSPLRKPNLLLVLVVAKTHDEKSLSFSMVRCTHTIYENSRENREHALHRPIYSFANNSRWEFITSPRESRSKFFSFLFLFSQGYIFYARVYAFSRPSVYKGQVAFFFCELTYIQRCVRVNIPAGIYLWAVDYPERHWRDACVEREKWRERDFVRVGSLFETIEDSSFFFVALTMTVIERCIYSLVLWLFAWSRRNF